MHPPAQLRFFSRFTAALTLGVAAFGLNGCLETGGFIDPTEPYIQPKEKGLLEVNVLDYLDKSVEQADSAYGDATDPRPEDLVVDQGDYRVGVSDLVQVSITDLYGDGTGETVKQVRVSESGNISLPFIRAVRAQGLTESELEDAIRKAYSDAGEIRNARVSVEVVEAQARAFTIQGNCTSPGKYQILTNDYRMLDALAAGRAPADPDIDDAYVIREPQPAPPVASPDNAAPENTNPATPQSTPTTNLLAPPSGDATPVGTVVPLMDNGAASQPSDNLLAPEPAPSQTGVIEGQAVTIHPDADSSATTQPAQTTEGASPFKFNQPAPSSGNRIIRVPIKDLLNGQLEYNIVIRPGDMIIIPQPVTGEYYLGGHIQRSGVYSLTGRNITLKQAITSGGGYEINAIPARTEIIRRIGDNKEIFVRIDLDKVWMGEQPDIYLKPNDIVYVGTNVWATFLSAFRTAFRITYGFGFLYDRNYSPVNNDGNLF